MNYTYRQRNKVFNATLRGTSSRGRALITYSNGRYLVRTEVLFKNLVPVGVQDDFHTISDRLTPEA